MEKVLNVRAVDVARAQNGVPELRAWRDRLDLEVYNPGSDAARLFYGRSPSCLAFDAGDYVAANGLAADAGLLAGIGGAIQAEVYLTASAANKTVFCLSKGSTACYLRFGFDSDEKLFASLQTGAGEEKWKLTANTALEAGVWHEVRLVHDGTAPRLVIDGDDIPITWDTETDKTAWVPNLAAVQTLDKATIGALYISSAVSQGFLGKLRSVVVAVRNELGRYVPVSRWQLDEGTGNPVDTKGNYDGTLGADDAAPAWALSGDGQVLPGGQAIYRDAAVPQGPVYGYTTAADVTLHVTEGR